MKLSLIHPDKRAFVTGAASGLGKAFCTLLARDGWTLGMSDINADALDTAVEEMQALGAVVHRYELDVANRDQYESVADAFLLEAGGIDLLINNAGVGDGGYIEDYGLDNWEWLLGINLNGVIYGCHFFIPAFKAQRSGHIINIASAAAIASAPGMAPYNVSKAAVFSLSETLLGEMADFGVGVTVLAPTFFPTNVSQYARGGDAIKSATEYLMKRATISADQVAAITLRKAGKGKFYVILPKEARILWLLKRLAPVWTLRRTRYAILVLLKRWEKKGIIPEGSVRK